MKIKNAQIFEQKYIKQYFKIMVSCDDVGDKITKKNVIIYFGKHSI